MKYRHNTQTYFQWLMMSCKDGVGQIVKAVVAVVTLVALTDWLCLIKAALDDVFGLARRAGDTIGQRNARTV